jgi:hypothetical protein
MSEQLPIWQGSSSFFPGDTPFGIYDFDQQFQCDIESTADWCAKRLGYGLQDVELQDKHFYAAFEEAINEYGNLVNSYAARDNLINLLGFSTGSNVNLSQAYVSPTLQGIFQLAREYGNEIGSGGTLTWYTGSFTTEAGRQVYDLITESTIEEGNFSTDKFSIRKIFHIRTPAMARYLDPTMGVNYSMDQFGWGAYTVPGSYLMMPLNYDILRIQAIEFNDEVRKSAYSFQLTNNRLRIFPIPTEPVHIHFHYTLNNQNAFVGSNGLQNTSTLGKISDHSNIPYYNITYKQINSMGKQWIRKYTLAICKEILGYIRGKYSALPIADGEVTLNATDLLTAGKEEKDALVTELKEMLDTMSRQSQLERKSAEAENLNNQLKWVPLKIYVR